MRVEKQVMPPQKQLALRSHSRRFVSVMTCVFAATGCRTPSESVETIVVQHQAMGRPSKEVLAAESAYADANDSGQAADPLPTGELTLETARAIAVRANPDIHAARARLEAAAAHLEEAVSRYYPTVTFSHNSARTFLTPASRNRLNTLLVSSQPVPLDVDINSPNPVLTTLLNALRRPYYNNATSKGNSNSFSEHSTALTFSWTAFDGFIRDAQILATQYLERAAEQSLYDLQRLIVHAVDTAYYQVQLAEEQLRIARADELFSREQFEETEKLMAAGRATAADVGNFRVRMLTAQAAVTRAGGVRETGRVVLAELVGRESSMLPDDVGLSPLAEESDEDMTLPGVDPWLDTAVQKRPDIAQLEYILDSEYEYIRAVQGQFSPSLLLSGSWGFDRSSNIAYSVQDQSAAAAMELRWELFSGGSREARLRAAEATKSEAQAMLNRLRLAVHSQVRAAVIDLEEAQTQILLQRENLTTARENRRVVQAAYLAGKETLTRLNEVQRDFIQADVNLTLARIRLRQAWSDLTAAAGGE